MQYAIETDPRSVQWPRVLQGLFLLWIFMDTEETTDLAPSKLNNKHTTFRPNSKCSGDWQSSGVAKIPEKVTLTLTPAKSGVGVDSSDSNSA